MDCMTPAAQGRLLEEAPIFAACPPALRDAIAARLTPRCYADGDSIFQRGDVGDSVMIVAHGQVALCVTSKQGRKILLGFAGRGEIFGELSAIDGQGRSADAVAMGDCLIQVLHRREMLRLLRQSPEASLLMTELLAARLRRTSDQLSGVALLTLPARLARLLLTLDEARGPQGAGPAPLPPLTQNQLAQLIGSGRPKVNVHLGRWIREGILRRDRGGLVVLDRDRLADIAEAGGF
jgi:CRP/FNR family cyclic AMP-dependent transcriptional regulator